MPRPKADRQWLVDLDAVNAGEQIAEALSELTVILDRLGGAAAIVAERRQIAPDLYVTSRLRFKHDLYASPVVDSEEEIEGHGEPKGNGATEVPVELERG